MLPFIRVSLKSFIILFLSFSMYVNVAHFCFWSCEYVFLFFSYVVMVLPDLIYVVIRQFFFFCFFFYWICLQSI
jgi:hypothetical protein